MFSRQHSFWGWEYILFTIFSWELTYPTWGQKIIFKSALVGDMYFHWRVLMINWLVVCFKYFLFSSLPGEMIQFD